MMVCVHGDGASLVPARAWSAGRWKRGAAAVSAAFGWTNGLGASICLLRIRLSTRGACLCLSLASGAAAARWRLLNECIALYQEGGGDDDHDKNDNRTKKKSNDQHTPRPLDILARIHNGRRKLALFERSGSILSYLLCVDPIVWGGPKPPRGGTRTVKSIEISQVGRKWGTCPWLWRALAKTTHPASAAIRLRRHRRLGSDSPEQQQAAS